MTTPTTPATSRPPRVTAYELRLDGHLDDHWSGLIGALTLIRCPDGTTTLTGPVADQTQLHGILARVRDLGVTPSSRSVSSMRTSPPAPHRNPGCRWH